MHWGKVNKTVGRRKSLIVLSKWKTASYSAKLLLKKIYMMMIISSSFCGLEISSSSEDTAAKKLTIFSVLIELSEATKSWHDTFVGTPGKNKLIENWIELISLHPPTCQIFNQENPWKSFFRSNFPCRFFICLSQFCKLIYQSDLVIHCFSDISWIIRDKTLQSIQAYNNTTLKEKFHLALTRNLQKHDSAFT